jgi:hypothetical protein
MQTRQEGLTATYNRFHNPHDRASDIRKCSLSTGKLSGKNFKALKSYKLYFATYQFTCT